MYKDYCVCRYKRVRVCVCEGQRTTSSVSLEVHLLETSSLWWW